ncbi:hypothetical protein [Streptomyces sp. NPDC048496]|uniref:hypothetical protein n=1 Tax=Streptomyces sp. NPDC048496 TaxID=3365558 RepID=UPI0037233AED
MNDAPVPVADGVERRLGLAVQERHPHLEVIPLGHEFADAGGPGMTVIGSSFWSGSAV